jgi:hypothetical protein
VVRAGHRGLPVAALLQLAVAEHDERPGAGAQQFRGQRAADRDREAVAEWAGVRLHARDLGAVRVAVERRQRGRERLERGPREEAAQRERGVERAGRVALAKDAAIAFRCVRPERVHVEHRAVERGQDVGHGEVAADVPEARSADHLQIRQPDLARQVGQRPGDVRDVGVGQLPPQREERRCRRLVNA